MNNKNKIGFTCGAFDLLHAGHVLMLKECKDYCDYLVVGVQSDPSIDRIDKNLPVMTYRERILMVSAVTWVDEIVLYDTEEDLYNLLRSRYNAGLLDIRIIGADWEGKAFTGHDLEMEVAFNSRNHNYSTSDLRKRVYDAELIRISAQGEEKQ